MINYYFGGKQALYDMVVAEAQGRLIEGLAGAVGRGGDESISVRLAVAYFDFLVEERELQRLLLRQLLDQGDAVRERAEQIIGPLRALLEQHFGDRAMAEQYALSVFGAISGYFIYEPFMGVFLQEDPLSARSLAVRRRHVAELASLIERSVP
jgi:AcrR family transcriptional regulator